ncbi:MAG: hypothetical protein K2V38_02465 [Gemmataceae bacterium]|nr:hypothetical protein [Gemmataceae bacterium]
MNRLARGAILAVTAFALVARADEKPTNIHTLKSDLTVPEVTDDEPAAGRRVRVTLPDHKDTKLFHVLYLPPDWKPGAKLPVIAEYPGNGGFENKLGDRSTGRVEDCKLGYGIGGGRGFVWVCLPFVDPKAKAHALKWWGDPDATATYCRAAVAQACKEFGGDPDAVILAGFSRGAIACGYIGLRDDATAKLWKAFIVHSHYDGVRRWNYPEDDPESARKRLARLNGRPQFVTHEASVEDTRKYLAASKVEATLLALPYPNHTDEWVLKDIPERAELRKWLADVLAKKN